MVTAIPTKVKELKEDAIKYLDKDKKYFMKEYKIIKPLLDEAKEIASNISNFRLEKHNRNELKLMISQLKKLERRQKWQQIRSRYPKLRKAMMNLLNLPIFNIEKNRKTKERITELMQKEHIFEGDSLKKTAEEIEPRFRRKNLHEIKWVEIVIIISVLLEDIQSLVYIVTQLEEAIEKV